MVIFKNCIQVHIRLQVSFFICSEQYLASLQNLVSIYGHNHVLQYSCFTTVYLWELGQYWLIHRVALNRSSKSSIGILGIMCYICQSRFLFPIRHMTVDAHVSVTSHITKVIKMRKIQFFVYFWRFVNVNSF